MQYMDGEGRPPAVDVIRLNQIKSLSRWKNFSSQAWRKTDALAKLLIEKGLITREEFMQKISEERATYQKLLQRKLAKQSCEPAQGFQERKR
jgi:hypothetical protein